MKILIIESKMLLHLKLRRIVYIVCLVNIKKEKHAVTFEDSYNTKLMKV